MDKQDILRSVASENQQHLSQHPVKASTWKKPSSRRHKACRQILSDEWKRINNTNNDAGSESTKHELTYFNLEAPPSIYPNKKYCDITGLKGHYKSPGTNLRFYNSEVYAAVIKPMIPGVDQQYLKLRGADVVLK
ncbi:related to Chromatin-remodeling complex subunit IES6 [Saccharomycodes ludwigii]|uniref:Related to Chromatin-remodeling complex subunit IES6 n=1 Tax=Saccharomycodes ludwigii TaxID=36035 RepID=A0A376B3A0_9ASCO|nr:hypothetical protein SCDLUD_003380 [Saccharomycodes ludwigii]KAH3900401.1 hypothetical protein SCDLUD_003380 [Saccharomycodes ludwigii]SSD59166.1 related to Chromatin-remodeling complex subunit IES6 [Saccharomycodes ludwigii]